MREDWRGDSTKQLETLPLVSYIYIEVDLSVLLYSMVTTLQTLRLLNLYFLSFKNMGERPGTRI